MGVYSGVTDTNLAYNMSATAVGRRNAYHVLLVYGAQELQTRGNLLLGVTGLYNRADDGDVDILRTNVVGG